MEILSCSAPYNEGGLGRFLATLVEDARERGELAAYYSPGVRPRDPLGHELSLDHLRWVFRAPPLRYHQGWRDFVAAELFDRAVAGRLAAADVLVGFSGRALRSFRRARALGFTRLVLESPTSHVDAVRRQHRLAARAYPIEESWLSGAQARKIRREYAAADVIQVTSEYARQSFISRGVPADGIARRRQRVAPRFAPSSTVGPGRDFHVVYVGRLQVSKGVPVLLDAFARLDDARARLTLVGGVATAAMQQYLTRRLRQDGRIEVRPGDPLPYLHRADVLVHPSFEDGLGLAPLEALACGVPVIVTEDTGMKEFVIPGYNGQVVPTGSVDALISALRTIRSHPLRGAFAAQSDGTRAPETSVSASASPVA